jgi:hypothetical protein
VDAGFLFDKAAVLREMIKERLYYYVCSATSSIKNHSLSTKKPMSHYLKSKTKTPYLRNCELCT